jgi:hypothetical protein
MVIRFWGSSFIGAKGGDNQSHIKYMQLFLNSNRIN